MFSVKFGGPKKKRPAGTLFHKIEEDTQKIQAWPGLVMEVPERKLRTACVAQKDEAATGLILINTHHHEYHLVSRRHSRTSSLCATGSCFHHAC